jgi:CTP:molybdopterin cytidylyltransferase MocA
LTASPAAPLLGAVVLAAGQARRMGGRPKPLIERDGIPLVRRVVLALVEAGVCEVVVVLGHRADEVAAALADLAVNCVVNESHVAGRVSSLRAGLAALAPDVAAVVVALADQPLLETADVSALIRAYECRGSARAVVPRVAGVRGHPVVFDAAVRDEILARDPEFGARQWLDANSSAVSWFDCDNAHYVEDVDVPQDLERIAQHYGCAMRWSK